MKKILNLVIILGLGLLTLVGCDNKPTAKGEYDLYKYSKKVSEDEFISSINSKLDEFNTKMLSFESDIDFNSKGYQIQNRYNESGSTPMLNVYLEDKILIDIDKLSYETYSKSGYTDFSGSDESIEHYKYLPINENNEGFRADLVEKTKKPMTVDLKNGANEVIDKFEFKAKGAETNEFYIDKNIYTYRFTLRNIIYQLQYDFSDKSSLSMVYNLDDKRLDGDKVTEDNTERLLTKVILKDVELTAINLDEYTLKVF